MADRKTIYLPDRVAEYLADSDVLSSRIAGIVLRYQQIAQRERPALTNNQWLAIADANNGADDVLLGDHPESLGVMLWANVADTPGLGEKWEIDQDALVAEMRSWTYVQQCAAFEALRAFWVHHQKPTDEAMRLAGMTE